MNSFSGLWPEGLPLVVSHVALGSSGQVDNGQECESLITGGSWGAGPGLVGLPLKGAVPTESSSLWELASSLISLEKKWTLPSVKELQGPYVVSNLASKLTTSFSPPLLPPALQGQDNYRHHPARL